MKLKKALILAILLSVFAANSVFAQQEIPMFFDSEIGLELDNIVTQVAFSPDGNKIAIASKYRKIVIFDTSSSRKITALSGHGNDILSGIVFSPNGRQLASFSSLGRNDATIKIWNVDSGALICNIAQRSIDAIAFSPDGSNIVGTYFDPYSEVGTRNREGIKIWNTTNGTEIRILAESTGMRSITYSPDGRQILGASTDGFIKIWNAQNGQVIRTINRETRFENAVYSPNGQYIAAIARIVGGTRLENTIIIYNAETGQELRSTPVRMSPSVLVYSPDGKQLFVNASDNTTRIFDPETGRELRNFNRNDTPSAFSSDGRRILTRPTSFRIGEAYYSASYATLLDATTGRTVGTIGYGPLNVGAKAYADMQIARFLNDTAAVTRNEAILQYVTSNGYATRAEIETFYRNNIRGLIAEIVDEEFSVNAILFYVFRGDTEDTGVWVHVTRNPQNGQYTLKYMTGNASASVSAIWALVENMKGIEEFSATSAQSLLSAVQNSRNFSQEAINTIRAELTRIPTIRMPASTNSYIKESLVNFYTTPNQSNFTQLRNIHVALFGSGDIGKIYNELTAYVSFLEAIDRTDLARNYQGQLRTAQNALNDRRTILRAPNNAQIDWGDLESAYTRVLDNLNADLAKKVRQ